MLSRKNPKSKGPEMKWVVDNIYIMALCAFLDSYVFKCMKSFLFMNHVMGILALGAKS